MASFLRTSGLRRAGAISGTCLAALALAASGAVSAAADGGSPAELDLSVAVTDYGVAAEEVSTSVADVGTLPDGTNVLFALGSGEPASLGVVNLDTGEVIDSQLIPPKTLAGATEVTDDGSLYFVLRDGSGALLLHWDSETHELSEIAENPVGERLVRSMETDDNGVLYGVTYPNAKLFSYDPAADEFRDYGSVVNDDIYAEGLAVHNGVAYVGTGMEVGHSVAVDLDTGDMTTMEFPAEYQGITRIYKSQLVGDVVAMAFSPGAGGTNTLFWDTVEQDWVCDRAIPSMLTLNAPFSAPTHDGRMFYKSQGEIWSFDSTDCSVEPTGWTDSGLEDTGTHRTLNLQTIGEGEDAQYRLVGLNRDGSFWTFDLQTGDAEFFEAQVPGAPLTAHSVHVAADDRVYIGTYHGPGTLGRFDIAAGELEQINGPSQADSWLDFQDQLLVGSYGNAVVHAGDPFAEWNWDTNPTQQFRLIDGHQQDRIVGQATDGQLVAMATVSDYGVRGGALTLTDMGDYRETFRDLVDHQSTASVTFGNDGMIYAGTSIRGGLSSADSPLDAHLVIFDPEAGEVIDAIVPVEGNDVVAGLATRGESIWGVTNGGHLFEYDTVAGEIIQVQDLGTGSSASPWGLASTVQVHPEDGLLYGLAGTAVFAFDPDSGQSQILLDDSDYKRMDIAADGTIYIIDETNLYSVVVAHDDEPGVWEVFKTANPASGSEVEVGDVLTYTVEALATSGEVVDAVVVDDLTDVLDDATLGEVQASAGEVAVDDGVLTWSGDLTAGEPVTVTYQVQIHDNGDSVLANTVSGAAETAQLVECQECWTTEHTVVDSDQADPTDPPPGQDPDPGEDDSEVPPPATDPQEPLPSTGASVGTIVFIAALMALTGMAVIGIRRVGTRTT